MTAVLIILVVFCFLVHPLFGLLATLLIFPAVFIMVPAGLIAVAPGLVDVVFVMGKTMLMVVGGFWLVVGLFLALCYLGDLFVAHFPRSWSAITTSSTVAARRVWRAAVLFVALCGLVFIFAAILGAGM